MEVIYECFVHMFMLSFYECKSLKFMNSLFICLCSFSMNASHWNMFKHICAEFSCLDALLLEADLLDICLLREIIQIFKLVFLWSYRSQLTGWPSGSCTTVWQHHRRGRPNLKWNLPKNIERGRHWRLHWSLQPKGQNQEFRAWCEADGRTLKLLLVWGVVDRAHTFCPWLCAH